MSSIFRTGRTVVVFRQNNLDAFIAAFVYWWLFGKDSIRPSDTLHFEAPKIEFRAVDPLDMSFHEQHAPAEEVPKIGKLDFIGRGDVVISIGTHLGAVPAASSFFSYENDESFTPFQSLDGYVSYYERDWTLTRLMLSSLIDAGHLSRTDRTFMALNQFFRFYGGQDEAGFGFDPKVSERILMHFPNLAVEDFLELNKLISDPLAFLDDKRQITPEAALAQRTVAQAVEAYERGTVIEVPSLYYPNGDVLSESVPLRLINSELVNHPAAQELFAPQRPTEAVCVYHTSAAGVRLKWLSSERYGEDALNIFPSDRPHIGSAHAADWLVTTRDLSSLSDQL